MSSMLSPYRILDLSDERANLTGLLLAQLGAEVIAVEPAEANAMALSIEAGEIVTLEKVPGTIADGLKPMAPGKLTLEAALEHVDRVLLVDDDSILRAQRLLLERAKLLVEPSGAAGVAALLGCEELAGLRVVTILTGGNTDLP